MTREAIMSAVSGALRKIAPEVDLAAVDPAGDLREQTDLDSMDFLNLVIGLHQALNVEIPEADYPRLATLDGLVAYLAAKLEAGARPTASR